jgi:hypothetical protein
MHYSYTGARRKTCLPSRSTQKCSTPTLGVNTKKFVRFFSPPNKCSKVLVAISQSFVAEKRHGAMQKLFIKIRKKRKKEVEKNGPVPEISKIIGT